MATAGDGMKLRSRTLAKPACDQSRKARKAKPAKQAGAQTEAVWEYSALQSELFRTALPAILEFLPDADGRACGQVCRSWRSEVAAINSRLARWENIVQASEDTNFVASATINFRGIARHAVAPARNHDYLWSSKLVLKTPAEESHFCFSVRLEGGAMSTYLYPLQTSWRKGKKLTFILLFHTGAATLGRAALQTRTASASVAMLRDHGMRKDGLGYKSYCYLGELPDRSSDSLSFIVGVSDCQANEEE